MPQHPLRVNTHTVKPLYWWLHDINIYMRSPSSIISLQSDKLNPVFHGPITFSLFCLGKWTVTMLRMSYIEFHLVWVPLNHLTTPSENWSTITEGSPRWTPLASTTCTVEMWMSLVHLGKGVEGDGHLMRELWTILVGLNWTSYIT